ncbi:MAG: MFS transporter [Chloroflexota bacterium]|nr:MFS transporter [Chloroflexota bacterium]
MTSSATSLGSPLGVAAARSARLAVALVFLVNGTVLANWVSRIPAIQQGLGLSEGILGFALLGAAVGALFSMPTAGWLISRIGSRLVTIGSGLCYCVALPGLAFAPNLPIFMLSLTLFGACNGAMDIAMNAQAAAVEERYRRPIMSSFHGLFSVGGMIGALMGGAAAAQGLGPRTHLSVVAVVLAGVFVLAVRGLLPSSVDSRSSGPAFARPGRTLLGLGLLTFCVMLGEGAMADWSAVYLDGTLGTSEAYAALGFGAFAVTMALGRLSGDWLSQRFGVVTLLRAGGIVSTVGLAAALLIGTPTAALNGFACAGAGYSVGVPLALSVAGRDSRMAPGPAIAAVATVGYFGFLVGPPVIGLVAELASLRVGLAVVVVLSAVYGLLAGTAART